MKVETQPGSPKPGDHLVSCRHTPDPDGARYYYVAEGGFEQIDVRTGVATGRVARWLLMCRKCDKKYRKRPAECPIGAYGEWPKDLEVDIANDEVPS